MSISDESFPDDDLYTTKINCKCNTSSSLSSSTPNDRNFSSSTSGQSSSGNSRETTQSDPVKVPEKREEEDYTEKVRSYQDLHSSYTKRRYPHVKSKVREFIESYKAEEEQRKSTRDYIQRLAHTEAKAVTVLESGLNSEDGCPEETQPDPPDIAKFMVEKEQESISQKALIEYLQDTLKEKRIEATRLRRNMDCLRVELMNAKDKAKRHSLQSVGLEYRASHSRPRLSLPTLVYMQQRTTTATQTDFDEEALQTTDDNNNSIGLYDQKIVATVQPLPLNYSTDHLRHIQRQIRHRSNSNPPTPTTVDHTATPNRVESAPSDSAIDTEEGDSSPENIHREEFSLFEKTITNDSMSFGPSTHSKKKRSFRRKLKWIFGPCGKCSDQKNNSSIGEQYSQTPLLDSMTFDNKTRVSDSNAS